MNCRAIIIAFALGLAASNARPSHDSTSGLQTWSSKGVSNMRGGRLGIYDGTSTTIDKHPYLVGVLVAGSLFCTGTIVHENWVVTLADCTKGLTAAEVTVVSGSSDGISGTPHTALELVTHPNYDSSTLDYDYTLIKVANFTWSNITKAANLPKRETKSVKLTVAGFSVSHQDVGLSKPELLEGSMTWLNRTTCQTYYPKVNLTSTMACAYDKGETTLCKGDYGDPFLKNSVYFGHFLAGSNSGFCTSKAAPVILADIHAVVKWIHKTIKTSALQ